jgi:hypothetical protein
MLPCMRSHQSISYWASSEVYEFSMSRLSSPDEKRFTVVQVGPKGMVLFVIYRVKGSERDKLQ